MKYTIIKDIDCYVVKLEGLEDLKYSISNTDLGLKEIKKLVEDNFNFIYDQMMSEKIVSLRNKRSIAFNKYDKYQLILMWESLSDNQKNQYIQWRDNWLNVTETLSIPDPLEWFN